MAGTHLSVRSAADRSDLVRGPALQHRRVWELELANQVAEVCGRSLDAGEILRGSLRRLERAFGAVGGAIVLRNHRSGEYELAAGTGVPIEPTAWDLAAGERVTPLDRVLTTRAPVILADVAFAPGWQTVVDTPSPVRSLVCVPIFVSKELIGALTLAAAMPHAFEAADARLLATIAVRVGAALSNARLHGFVRRAKREWEQTFDAIGDPMAVFDSDGALVRGNSALAALLGRPVTDLPRTTCREIGFCTGPFPRCAVGDAVHRGAVGRAEVTLASGQIFSVTTFPVCSGETASVVQVAQNVTEEIRAARRLRRMRDELGIANARLTATVSQLESTQAQLLQAEKLSALGQLVAGVGHELNNPLTSVIGYAQLLEDELLDTGWAQPRRPTLDIAQDLRRIVEESERAARIVRDLLAFARRQSAARAPQDVVELMARVLSLRAYELRLNAIEVCTEFEPGLPPILADGGQIQQALLNLVLNAEQAMQSLPTRRLTVAARFDRAAAAIQLSVTDTGHGMDAARLTRIFDPFFTTRQVGEGTGLGLSICYGVVRDHGGEILVESQPQVGTTFSVLLPARTAEARPDDEVLVAHADHGQRDFISAALLAWGFTVTSTSDAAEAVTRFQAAPLVAALVDREIVASDPSAWLALAADCRRTPLVLMAGAVGEGELDRFGREQACAVLTPPFQLRALRSAIRVVAKECV